MPAGQLSIAQRPEVAARRSRAPRTPQKASPPVVALKPLSAEGNAFSGAFSGHMDAAFKTVGFAWDRLGTRAYDVFVDCFAKGLLIRVTGDIIALSPPLIISAAQIDELFGMLEAVLRDLP